MLERGKGDLGGRSKTERSSQNGSYGEEDTSPQKLVLITDRKAEAAERELACITNDEDKDQFPVKEIVFLPPSPCISTDGLQMNPQEWSHTEFILQNFWRSPGLQSLADDGTVFGEFGCA